MESDGIEEMKKVCEDLWKVIQQKHLDVRNSREVYILHKGNVFKLLKENIRKVHGEIEALIRKQPEGLFNSPDAQIDLLKEELKLSFSQLKETLSVARVERKKMAEDILREEEVVTQLESINQVLKTKVDQSQTEINYTEERYFMDLKKKENLIRRHHENLMKTTVDFLNEYFPPPKPSGLNKTSKRRTRRQSMNATDPTAELHSLKSIIESLMNKCLETPHDAYLAVDDKFWQPYITLLIRCNIAMFHPEDDKRIKLIPFHL